jgi:hypothetical protein
MNSWIANNKLEILNRFRYNCASADHRVFADVSARKDGSVGSDGCTLTNRRSLCVLVIDPAARPHIVRESHVRPNEHLIPDLNAIPHADAVLDGNVIADNHAGLDKRMIPDIAPLPYFRTLHNMRERPYARTRANLVGLYECLGVDENWGGHELFYAFVPKARIASLVCNGDNAKFVIHYLINDCKWKSVEHLKAITSGIFSVSFGRFSNFGDSLFDLLFKI